VGSRFALPRSGSYGGTVYTTFRRPGNSGQKVMIFTILTSAQIPFAPPTACNFLAASHFYSFIFIQQQDTSTKAALSVAVK